MIVKNRHTGETIRIFWYQYVKYRWWFIKNFISLFSSIVFRDWYGQIMWPHMVWGIASNIWLDTDARDFRLIDRSL